MEGLGSGSSMANISKLTYPDRPLLYTWNLLKKIEVSIGQRPLSIHITNGEIHIQFEMLIDNHQKEIVDKIMADKDPSIPPKSPTVFLIKDLDEHIDIFEKEIGIKCSHYFSKINSETLNTIELHFEKELTEKQIFKIYKIYSTFIEIMQ